MNPNPPAAPRDGIASGPDVSTGARLIRVAIVDDSVVARRVLDRILTEDGRFTVCGSYSSAELALETLPDTPVDVIVLDLEMPGRGGLLSLPDLLAASRKAAVVILSGHHAADGEVAVRALADGARDILTKPDAGHFHSAFAATLTDRLHAIATGQDRSGWKGGQTSCMAAPWGLSTIPRAIAIGASTGGIAALASFFKALGSPPVPVFVTQHLPADFLPFFARQLGDMTCAPVELARQGTQVAAGHVYVAPGEAHLTLERGANRHILIALSRQGSRHGAFPAVDPMFASVADLYGAGACGIVFSGMGRDGLSGAEAIGRSGGSVIAQDSATSVVWGMPGAVINTGLANVVASPAEAAMLLRQQWSAAA